MDHFFSECFNTAQPLLSVSNEDPLNYLEPSNPKSTDGLLSSEEEVHEIIMSLDASKANWPDGMRISAKKNAQRYSSQHHPSVNTVLSSNHPLDNTQWGFQSGKSTATALLTACKEMEAGKEVCSVFFDIRKAFDAIPLREIVQKICKLHINPSNGLESISQWDTRKL